MRFVTRLHVIGGKLITMLPKITVCSCVVDRVMCPDQEVVVTHMCIYHDITRALCSKTEVMTKHVKRILFTESSTKSFKISCVLIAMRDWTVFRYIYFLALVL